MMKPRDQIEQKDKWNVEAFFQSPVDWEKAFQAFKDSNALEKIDTFKGTLHQSPEQLKKAFDLFFEVDRELSRLYTYAHLRHDEDIANDAFKVAYQKIVTYLHRFGQETSWVEPEIVGFDPQTIETFLNSSALQNYRFHLEKILRIKAHTLPKEQEKLLSQAMEAQSASHKAFSAINDADFNFGSVLNEKGESKPLSHASYSVYMRDFDRTLRKNTFLALQGKYKEYENTLCELLSGQTHSHLFQARARNYESCLEAALFPKNIPTSVYHALIEAVNSRLPVFHRYLKLREKVLQLEPMHLYDMQVPITKNVDIKMGFKEAVDVIIESVAPLGKEYQDRLRKGFNEERWVDVYENKNKRSGAYSSGCFDSFPYILMNYKDLMRDVFTLAHEAGHSMHSTLTHENQSYAYANYSIFLAEVASTFNEELLMRKLLSRPLKKEERIFLLNQKVEDIRGTLFRQTMFAEFELYIHSQLEKGEPLTPLSLKEKYMALNRTYFGTNIEVDEEIAIEWARIPHFYYNFYVFQYATGISAALSLADKVMNGGEKERNDYLSFLKGGSSLYPIDMLKKAGVDMTTTAPVHSAIDRFEELVKELEKELAVSIG